MPSSRCCGVIVTSKVPWACAVMASPCQPPPTPSDCRPPAPARRTPTARRGDRLVGVEPARVRHHPELGAADAAPAAARASPFGRSNATRYAVIPSTATTRGRCCGDERLRAGRGPRAAGHLVSSSARAVANGTRLVIADAARDRASPGRPRSSPAGRRRAARADRLRPAPGGSGCRGCRSGSASAAVIRPGLMPDEHQPHPGPDQVGHLGAAERLQLGTGEAGHGLSLPRRTRDARADGRAPARSRRTGSRATPSPPVRSGSWRWSSCRRRGGSRASSSVRSPARGWSDQLARPSGRRAAARRARRRSAPRASRGAPARRRGSPARASAWRRTIGVSLR